jgi:hypothetical protein
MNLVVGFPLYRQMPATFFAHWMHMDQSQVRAAITVNGAYLTVAMDLMVEKALAIDNWDRLLVFEHDVIPAKNALNRVASYSPEQAVVGSMIFGHDPPHTAMVYIEQPDGAFDPITPDTVRNWCADPMLYRCDATGFGFTSIARHVLKDWPADVPMFSTSKGIGSHDLWFCHHARQAGHHVFVDSGIVCEHLTEIPIGLSHNQDCAHMINGADIINFDYAEP